MPPDSLILSFDTSAAHCAAALLCGDKVLAQRTETMATGQAERLFPMLEEMLAGADKTWADLAAIGVGIGPGNFTGIRISVAAARGLALSLGIPAVGVDGFEARAEGLARPVRIAIPAPRDLVYLAEVGPEGAGTPELVGQEQASERQAEAGATPLAAAIARIAARRLASGAPLRRPAPLYIRPADAAPPRDPAPVILP